MLKSKQCNTNKNNPSTLPWAWTISSVLHVIISNHKESVLFLQHFHLSTCYWSMDYFATIIFLCFSLALFWEVHKPKSMLSLFLNYFPKVKAVVSDERFWNNCCKDEIAMKRNKQCWELAPWWSHVLPIQTVQSPHPISVSGDWLTVICYCSSRETQHLCPFQAPEPCTHL